MSRSLAMAMAVKRRMGKKMADGGDVKQTSSQPQPEEKKKEPMYSDDGGAFKHAKFDPDKMDAVQKSMNRAFKFAKGGEVGHSHGHGLALAVMKKRMEDHPKPMRMAEGGMTEDMESEPDMDFLSSEEQTPYFHESDDDEPKPKDRLAMMDEIFMRHRKK